MVQRVGRVLPQQSAVHAVAVRLEHEARRVGGHGLDALGRGRRLQRGLIATVMFECLDGLAVVWLVYAARLRGVLVVGLTVDVAVVVVNAIHETYLNVASVRARAHAAGRAGHELLLRKRLNRARRQCLRHLGHRNGRKCPHEPLIPLRLRRNVRPRGGRFGARAIKLRTD